jgi:uracil-DNA glycosylase family 4
MGFFFSKNNSEIKKSKSKELPLEFYHNNSCKVCTLKNESIRNPRMLPTGSDKPIIYILGEAPGKTEDKEGLQFVGDSGQLLRSTLEKYFGKIPYRKLKKDSFQIRFNNCIRCHPPSNRNPSELEIECCRKSIEDDIEKTKPLIIIGIGDDITGNTPLEWMLNVSGINLWRGRKFASIRSNEKEEEIYRN